MRIGVNVTVRLLIVFIGRNRIWELQLRTPSEARKYSFCLVQSGPKTECNFDLWIDDSDELSFDVVMILIHRAIEEDGENVDSS